MVPIQENRFNEECRLASKLLIKYIHHFSQTSHLSCHIVLVSSRLVAPKENSFAAYALTNTGSTYCNAQQNCQHSF